MRGKLSGAEKDDLRSLEKKLEKRLNTGYRNWSSQQVSLVHNWSRQAARSMINS